jgi:hypothetical protein
MAGELLLLMLGGWVQEKLHVCVGVNGGVIQSNRAIGPSMVLKKKEIGWGGASTLFAASISMHAGDEHRCAALQSARVGKDRLCL